MKPRVAESSGHSTPHRLAWLLSFAVTVALIVLLNAVRSADAAAPHPPGTPFATPLAAPFEEWEEEEEGEGEEPEVEFEAEEWEEECEEGFGEEEECEAEGQPGAGLDAGVDETCMLRSATAKVTALPARNRVRLRIRYAAFSGAVVALDYRLRGGRGSLRVAADTKRFSRRGTYRRTDKLTNAQMRKALAAREFTVHLYAINTPRRCRHLFDSHLTKRRNGGHGTRTWSAPRRSRTS
jgi:hypothetical protein